MSTLKTFINLRTGKSGQYPENFAQDRPDWVAEDEVNYTEPCCGQGANLDGLYDEILGYNDIIQWDDEDNTEEDE